jgi:hypothetical protein
VQPIERYELVFDENHMPSPVAAPQGLGPWKQALATLLSSRKTYEAEAERSRQAALRFVGGLRAERFEEMLRGLGSSAAALEAKPASRLASLSPARRALLAQRLRERSTK